MKIIKINGTLPEQMFQYALYLRLRHDGQEVSLAVPRMWIAKDLGLSGYGVASDEQLKKYQMSLVGRIKNVFGKNSVPENVITDAFGEYSRKAIDADEALLVGTWASPRYFESVADDVRGAFILLKQLLSAATRSIVALMAECDREVVAMHIHQPTSQSNTCTTDYYNWAIANIRTYIPDAQFFVFTDSPAIVKQHILLPEHSRMIPTSNLSDLDLLQILLRANHNICANTLISWWSAWLNPNPDKIVIVPQRWSVATQPTDLIPIYWTAIPTT